MLGNDKASAGNAEGRLKFQTASGYSDRIGGDVDRFSGSVAECLVQHGEKFAAVAGGNPASVLFGKVITAAFGGNPQFLVRRVAVDNDLRAVVGLDGKYVAAELAVEIPTAFVYLVFNVGE